MCVATLGFPRPTFLSADPGRPPPAPGVAARPGENRNHLGLRPSQSLAGAAGAEPGCATRRATSRAGARPEEGLRPAGRASRRGPGGLLVRRVRGTQPSPLGSRGLPSAPQVQGRARASAGPGTRPSDAGSPLPAPGARPSQARGHPRPAPSRVLTLLSGGTCHPEEAQTSTRSDDFPQSDATAAPEVPPRARLVLRHTCGR